MVMVRAIFIKSNFFLLCVNRELTNDDLRKHVHKDQVKDSKVKCQLVYIKIYIEI